MAITNLRIVTGQSGGDTTALGDTITNVGTGADVTWPVAGNPSLALTGLYYTSAEGTGIINLTTASDRGTHYAWDSQGDGDSQPAWATGPGYIELPANATAQRVEFLINSTFGTLSGTNWSDGLDVTVGIQFAISGTYNPGTVPQNNNTAISIMEPSYDSAAHAQVRVQSRNVEGWDPGLEFSFGAYTGTYTLPGGGLSSDPGVHIPYNQWVPLRVHWRRATNSTSNDGRIMVWLGDQLICYHTEADCWFSSAGTMARLVGLLSSYSTAITGCKIRYCPPIKVRIVPEADLVAEGDWAINTTEDRDLRRFYSCTAAGAGTHWAFTGTATLPTVGTKYSSTGNNPLRRRFVIAGTAAQTFLATMSKFVWEGNAADDPRGSDGRVWYRFTDLYTANNCDITITIDGNASSTTLHTIVLKKSTNELTVDGVSIFSSLQTSTRFELLVGIGTSNTVILLNDITTLTKAATALRSAIVTTFAGSARWDGTTLGVFYVGGVFAGSVSAEIGPVSIMSRCRVYECDSFAETTANGTSPALSCTANHLGLYVNNAEDRMVAGGYDFVPYTGGITGLCVGLMLARSGAKLSESETHYWDNLTGFTFHGLLLGGVINDVTAANDTFAEADTETDAIAERIADWCDLCVDSGGTSVVFEAINAASGSLTGSHTNVSMGEPGLVWAKLPGVLRSRNYRRGGVFHSPAFRYVIGNAVSSDGIHPATAGSRNIMLVNHRALEDAKGTDGFNADGSIRRVATGSSLSMIESMIG